MRLALLAVLVLLAGCATPAPTPTSSGAGATATGPQATSQSPAGSCPGHWHATFAIYVPKAGGEPAQVDMASPRASTGAAYYDLFNPEVRAHGMGLAVHMHQGGPETGGNQLGPTQWHFEAGICVGVAEALHAVEVNATATTLTLWGAHAQVHQAGTWTANATARLRFFVEAKDAATGNWTWHERTLAEVADYQLPDGASLLVAFGAYSDAQVGMMERSIPAPISRA